MQVAPPSHDLLVHARTMISIIMGLSMARLLNGVAGLIQHPKKEHLWWPHLCWVLYMMVSITAFWWWQFQLNRTAGPDLRDLHLPDLGSGDALPAVQRDLSPPKSASTTATATTSCRAGPGSSAC
jgi:hypothetical protein